MPKATSARNSSGSNASASRKAQSAERNAAKVVDAARKTADRLRVEAEADAARIRGDARADATRVREEAEEHARRLILDARASADGVRAEGMELVSNLRLMGDSLRERSERLLEDIQEIHARMVGELEAAAPDGRTPGGAIGPSEPAEELDVPDFVHPH